MSGPLNTKTKKPSKENIVFVHGFPLNGSIWSTQIKALKEHYNCYALDLPGYGSTISPKNYNHSIDSYADHTFQFINENKLASVHIVGMSMGGSVVLNLSRRYIDVINSHKCHCRYRKRKEGKGQGHCKHSKWRPLKVHWGICRSFAKPQGHSCDPSAVHRFDVWNFTRNCHFRLQGHS